MAEWFYTRDGEKHGPIRTRDLRALAQNGEISRNDLIWRDGLDDWVKAKTVKGLFSSETKTQQPPEADLQSQQSPSKSSAPPIEECGETSEAHSIFDRDKLHDTGTKLGESAKAFGSAASRAVKASMIQAEITKINTVNLPRAYSILGEAMHQRDEIQKQFPEIVARISEMISKIASLHPAERNSETQKSFGEKAKSIASAAKAKGHKIILDQQLRNHFGELGKLMFETDRLNGAPEELVQTITEHLDKLRSRHSDLDEQKSELAVEGGKSYSGLAGAAKNYPKAAGCICVFLALFLLSAIGSFLFPTNDSDGVGKENSEQAVASKQNDIDGQKAFPIGGIHIRDKLFRLTEFSNGLAIAKNNAVRDGNKLIGDVCLINSENKIVVPVIEINREATISQFSDGVAIFGIPAGRDKWGIPQLLYGLFDDSGKILLSAEYNLITNFSEGYALITKRSGKSNLDGVISNDGSFVVPLQDRFSFRFSMGDRWFSEGLILYTDNYADDGLWGFGTISSSGSWRIVISARKVKAGAASNGVFSEGLASVELMYTPEQLNNGFMPEGWGKHGYVNKSGDWVIQPIFEWAFPFKNGQAEVRFDGKDRTINREGEFVD